MKKVLTLCFPIKDSQVLLGLKKRNFGVGIWNGFGGKVEQGETIEEGAIRELKEESSIVANKIEKIGILNFEFQNDPEILLEVHIFLVKDFSGEPEETEEMKPEWFDVNNLPFDQMWAGDKYWLPLVLNSRKFKGRFLFDKPSSKEYNAKIIEQELLEVDNLEYK